MQSSKKFRPKTLDQLIGQDKLVKLIRNMKKKNALPSGFLFTGPKGSGKSTIAYILALAFQCTHQKVFGQPCDVCRKRRSKFPIYEINCGKIRGVKELEDFIQNSDYEIIGEGKKRIYILDEAHRLSGHAQDTLLIPTEKMNSNNVWIMCSTRSDKIIGTLRSRFQTFNLKELYGENTEQLVKWFLKKNKSKLNSAELADALADKGITSGRLIGNAVDLYISGASADEASEVDGDVSKAKKALVHAVRKGAWGDAASILKKISPGDVRLLRAGIIGYLRAILLDFTEIDDRSKALSLAIKNLAYVTHAEESNQLAALSAELFTLCELFSKYSM